MFSDRLAYPLLKHCLSGIRLECAVHLYDPEKPLKRGKATVAVFRFRSSRFRTKKRDILRSPEKRDMEKQDKNLEMFCSALELKEKKIALYAEAMKACSSPVGVETFKMLLDAETQHMNEIQKVYEELKKGKVSPDACRLTSVKSADRNSLIRGIISETPSMPKACLDDVAAIDAGIRMEEASIEFYRKQLEHTVDSVEHKFLNRIIEEEREHYKALADLRFYYVDPANWFMEKNRSGLDGAGAVT
jgi:rubrerythrin